MAERRLHCWADEREHIAAKFGENSDEYWVTYSEDYVSGTCMLERGHGDPHVFTPDDQIGVRFEPAAAPQHSPIGTSIARRRSRESGEVNRSGDRAESCFDKMTSNIAKRLRERDWFLTDQLYALADEAAAEIERLEASAASRAAIEALVGAAEPFANVARQIQANATDNRWLETVLFYMGDVSDPTKWSLTGKAFAALSRAVEDARGALSHRSQEAHRVEEQS